MRHQKKGKKFGRETGQRRALFKTLAHSFIKYEKLTTTEPKAKELRPKIEKLITRAKNNTIAARRILLKEINKIAVKKLITEIAPKFQGRAGGYTRIVKLGRRKSDNSPMAKIELV